MVLAVHPPPGGEMKEIELPFEPPMADFREFRSRLIGWRDEAFKRYNVVRLIAYIHVAAALRETREDVESECCAVGREGEASVGREGEASAEASEGVRGSRVERNVW